VVGEEITLYGYVGSSPDLWPSQLGNDGEALLRNAMDLFPLSIFIFREPVGPDGYLPMTDKSDFEASRILQRISVMSGIVQESGF
jgi:hypothetical protein